MNDDITTAVKVLAVAGGITLIAWLGIVMVKAAKRGGGGMRGIGAALMMFGWATMRDPPTIPWPKRRTDASAKARTGDPLDPKQER